MTRGRGVPRPLAAAAGLALDRLLPEPPSAVHPVVLFATVMTGLERRIHRDERGVGLLHALVGVTLGLGVGAVVRSTALATSSAVAGRALAASAVDVGRALEAQDLDGARRLLPSLVGRDPSELGPGEIARAVVESVAENTVDAVVAPGVLGRGGRCSRCARLPLGEHSRFHGRPPLAALRELRLGQRSSRRRCRLGAGPADRGARRPGPAPRGAGGVGCRAAPGARPPLPERRRG